MKPNPLPDCSFLCECFDYDPNTGILTWKKRPKEHFASEGSFKKWNNQFPGKQAFTSKDGEGYLYGSLSQNGKRTFYKAHRIIWKMVHGYDPDQIDHDNRVRTDNRITNLKAASAVSNARNRKMRADNTTGYTGVELTPSGKFVARFAQEYIGTYDSALEAHQAREKLKQSKNYHPKHGI